MAQDNANLIWQAKQVLDFNWTSKYARRYLVSDASAYVTGSTFFLDGGHDIALRQSIKPLSCYARRRKLALPQT